MKKRVFGAVPGMADAPWAAVVVLHSGKAQSEVAQSVHMNHSVPV